MRRRYIRLTDKGDRTMDMDYNLQIVAANCAVRYLEEEISNIDKYIGGSPTDDYKFQVISVKSLYNMYLEQLKEWLDSQEK